MAVTITINHEPARAFIHIEYADTLRDITIELRPADANDRLLVVTSTCEGTDVPTVVTEKTSWAGSGAMARAVSRQLYDVLATILAVDNPEHVHGG